MKSLLEQDDPKTNQNISNNFPLLEGDKKYLPAKIAILGIGGVGGYYGGKLAQTYYKTNDVNIFFIARGEHLKVIQANGLHVITDEDEFTALPVLATDDAKEIGICDYVIITTKSYDLKSSIEQIKPCIGDSTVILPLLNGGDISKKIREILPENKIWDGLSYIVSRKTAQGEIHTYGTSRRLVFGSIFDNDDERLRFFETLMRNAGIDAVWSKNIRESVWKKFFLISVSASLTSYFNVSFNDLADNEKYRPFTIDFAKEFMQVAEKEGLDFGEKELNDMLNGFSNLPKGSTTSMHSDFQQGGSTEVETLTGEIVRLAHKYNLQAPFYEKVYSGLINKSQ